MLNHKNWMQQLNGALLLNQLTIPGTHDSGTQHVTFSRIARCQNTDIAEQLCNGFRFLDIRLMRKKETMFLIHGQANCKQEDMKTSLSFDHVLEHCYQFLNNNPSETIIMSIKMERGFQKNKFAQVMLEKYYTKNAAKWYLKNTTPRLDDVRGKIVLLRRYRLTNYRTFTDDNSGLNFSVWPDQKSTRSYESITSDMQTTDRKSTGRLLEIQDRYSLPPNIKWKQCVLPMLNKNCVPNNWFLNFLSTMHGGCPERSAAEMNQIFSSFSIPNGRHGVIICDYGTAELAQKIYGTNF